jgi:hypothetical protein
MINKVITLFVGLFALWFAAFLLGFTVELPSGLLGF